MKKLRFCTVLIVLCLLINFVVFADTKEISENETKDEEYTESKVVLTEDGMLILPRPIKEKKIFVEWNTKEDGTGKGYKAGEIVDPTDIVLYSIWVDELNEQLLSLKTNNDELEDSSDIEKATKSEVSKEEKTIENDDKNDEINESDVKTEIKEKVDGEGTKDDKEQKDLDEVEKADIEEKVDDDGEEGKEQDDLAEVEKVDIKEKVDDEENEDKEKESGEKSESKEEEKELTESLESVDLAESNGDFVNNKESDNVENNNVEEANIEVEEETFIENSKKVGEVESIKDNETTTKSKIEDIDEVVEPTIDELIINEEVIDDDIDVDAKEDEVDTIEAVLTNNSVGNSKEDLTKKDNFENREVGTEVNEENEISSEDLVNIENKAKLKKNNEYKTIESEIQTAEEKVLKESSKKDETIDNIKEDESETSSVDVVNSEKIIESEIVEEEKNTLYND